MSPKSHISDNNSSTSHIESQSPTTIARSPNSLNKRSPNMILSIDHLLPNATAHASSYHDSASLVTIASQAQELSCRRAKNSNSGVYVSQTVARNTVSLPLASHALISVNIINDLTARVYCSLATEDGDYLLMTPSIMRRIRLSEDIHSYNALFELHKGDVRLRIVRDITKDDEIVAWFGEEISLLMSIPFLTPLNIQGNNKYTCHLCHLTFETPNPLKIHIVTSCGRYSIDILWMRLHYAIKATAHYSQLTPIMPMLSARLPSPIQAYVTPSVPSASTSPRTSATAVSVTHSPQPSEPHDSAMPRFSAFKPISPSTSYAHHVHTHLQHQQTRHPITTAATSIHPMQATTTTAALSFLPSISRLGLPHMSLLQAPSASNPLNAAAQIEAIVSNMGASKQGHLCIYCGKVYSRKYGLKIHIRTHTGFKPLKCKFCHRPFGDPSNLNKHVRLHLQSANAASGAGSQQENTSEEFQCEVCHKSFGRRRELLRHLETRHECTTSNDAFSETLTNS